MGATWSKTTPHQMMRKIESVKEAIEPRVVQDIVVEELDAVQREEVKLGRQYTESRPSAKSGKAGRVETGAMRDHITGETRRKADGAYTRVGFLAGVQGYFRWQTSTGFSAGGYRPAQYIEPTFALKDAHEDVKPLLQQAGTNVLRQLSAKIRKAL